MPDRTAPVAKQERTRRFYVPIMLAPVFVVFALLFVGALITALLQSFGYAPIYGLNDFPTLRYYGELFALPGFWRAVFNTFYYALTPTVVGTMLSVALALILRKYFKGKRLFIYIYKLPLMIPYLVGIALVILFFSNGGIIARLLYAMGIIEETGDFPRLLNTQGGWGIMFVYLWKQVPFTALIIHSVLLGLGPEYEEAASSLGATPLKTFWYVTLPQIMPGVVTATVIVFAFNFGSFEAPFILGGGFPSTLPVEAWRAFDDADYTRRLRAMAIVMFISVVSGALLYFYLTLYRRFERRRGRS